jgi:hypothetical protein
MFLTAMHVATVLLVALVMGTTLAHALEMPAKMRLSGSFWVECQHTLYRFFRYIAGPIEVAAVLISAALAYFTFGRAAFGASLVASILLIIAFVVWAVVTERVNRQVAKWTAADIPWDWERWRTQWEYSHLVRFLLHFVAFVSSLVAALIHESNH